MGVKPQYLGKKSVSEIKDYTYSFLKYCDNLADQTECDINASQQTLWLAWQLNHSKKAVVNNKVIKLSAVFIFIIRHIQPAWGWGGGGVIEQDIFFCLNHK